MAATRRVIHVVESNDMIWGITLCGINLYSDKLERNHGFISLATAVKHKFDESKLLALDCQKAVYCKGCMQHLGVV